MDFAKSREYIAAHRSETIENMCRFLQTDTLLFWSDNEALFEYQKKHWQPVLDMLNAVFKLDLQTTTGLTPPDNKHVVHEFSRCLNNMSDNELTGCFLAASEMKSVLLGLLLAKKEISASEAFKNAFLEELFQNQSWGEDFAAVEAREITKKHLEQIEGYLKNDGTMLKN